MILPRVRPTSLNRVSSMKFDVMSLILYMNSAFHEPKLITYFLQDIVWIGPGWGLGTAARICLAGIE